MKNIQITYLDKEDVVSKILLSKYHGIMPITIKNLKHVICMSYSILIN